MVPATVRGCWLDRVRCGYGQVACLVAVALRLAVVMAVVAGHGAELG